jgi:hypothetical protein
MAFTGNYTCDVFKTGLFTGSFNLLSPSTFKMALYTNNATLDANTTAYTSVGEASGGNYVAGGQLLAGASLAISNNIAYLSFNNPSWTGSITARGALIYQNVANGAVCVLDFGNDKTSTNTFTVQFPPAYNTTAIIRLV